MVAGLALPTVRIRRNAAPAQDHLARVHVLLPIGTRMPVDYLGHLGASALWTFLGHRYVFGAADNKDPPADQPQIRAGVKPNALDGMVFRFNPFMFKNPGMQACLMNVIASDPAAETIKESVKNQTKNTLYSRSAPLHACFPG